MSEYTTIGDRAYHMELLTYLTLRNEEVRRADYDTWLQYMHESVCLYNKAHDTSYGPHETVFAWLYWVPRV